MPFLLAEILNFQGSTHLIGVGSFSNLYEKIDRWWINEIEIPTSADEIPEDYDRDGVCGGRAIVLSIINDIVLGNGGEKYKNILNELLKQK